MALRPKNDAGHNLTQHDSNQGWYASLGGAIRIREGAETAYVQRQHRGWYGFTPDNKRVCGPYRTRREAMRAIEARDFVSHP